MDVEIFQPAKSAMQSGRANTRRWQIRFKPSKARQIDSLMGYVGAGNIERQVKLSFATKADAIAYAEANGLSYQVREPKARRVPIKAYADNFKARV